MPLVLDQFGGNLQVSLATFNQIVEGNHPLSPYNTGIAQVMATRKKRAPGSNVLAGADPEFFVANSKRLVPSCGLIGGTKEKGVVISQDLGPKFTWLEDNVAVELNVPPTSNSADFSQGMRMAVRYAIQELKSKSLHAVFKPCLKFKDADLVDPKAGIFGCEPDFCAYDSDTRKKRVVDVDKFGTTRFAGGHLHLSFNNKEQIPVYAVVMALDAFIGLPSIGLDTQGERRAAYGLAGLYRTKKYTEEVQGVEYRTLSNFWLPWANNDNILLMQYMIDTLLAVGYIVQERPIEFSKLFTRLPLRDIQNAINSEDKKQAAEIHEFVRQTKETAQAEIPMYFRPGMKLYAPV